MGQKIRLFGILVLGAVAALSASAQASSTQEAAVSALVKSFLHAEQAYDAPALAKLISDRYIEVSPAGEVDAHDRFLGFYAADKKADWPPMQTSEEQVRVFGDTAIDILKFTYTMPAPNGGTRAMEIRGSFTAQREHGAWKLIGAQYTGIRPAPAAK